MRDRPGCYQCPDDGESLDEIQARRKQEVRDWADAQIAAADAALVGVPLGNFEADLLTQTIPEDQQVPEPDNTSAVPDNSTSTIEVDATAKAAVEEVVAQNDAENLDIQAEKVADLDALSEKVAEHEEEAPKTKHRPSRKATDPT